MEGGGVRKREEEEEEEEEKEEAAPHGKAANHAHFVRAMLTLRSLSQQPRRTTQSYWSDDERPSNKTAEWASLDVGGKLLPSWLRWTCVGLHDQCEFGSAISPTTTYVYIYIYIYADKPDITRHPPVAARPWRPAFFCLVLWFPASSRDFRGVPRQRTSFAIVA